MEHCKNCGAKLTGLYCSHCGQKANVERITFSYVVHELFHFFTHIESGFLYTSLQMLKAPGITVRNIIDGKRKRYQPPISYFVIWTTAYILFLYGLEKVFGENVVINYKDYFGPSGITELAIGHLSIVLLIVIPFHALYLYLLVTRTTYGYFETLVAVIYFMGTIILLQFVFAVAALIVHLLFSVSVVLNISDVLKVFYLTWFIADLIKLFPVKVKLLRATVFVVLAFGTFTLWRLYGYPVLAQWLF